MEHIDGTMIKDGHDVIVCSYMDQDLRVSGAKPGHATGEGLGF